MTKGDSWGDSYLTFRGGILRFVKEELLRKHSPRMLPLMKNDSSGFGEN